MYIFIIKQNKKHLGRKFILFLWALFVLTTDNDPDFRKREREENSLIPSISLQNHVRSVNAVFVFRISRLV